MTLQIYSVTSLHWCHCQQQVDWLIKHFQIHLFGFSSPGFSHPTVPERSSQRADFIWASPPPSLSSCHVSLSLSPPPPVSRPGFYFFSPFCSSRVVLSGPVLPETPRHISSFCLLSFPFQASLSLNALPPSVEFSLAHSFSLFLYPTPCQQTEKGSHLKLCMLLSVCSLYEHLDLNPFFSKFQEVIHWRDKLII